MSSTLFYNQISPSNAVFLRTQYQVLFPEDISSKFVHSLHHKACFKNQGNRHVKKLERIKAKVNEAANVGSAETDGNSRRLDKKLRILVAGGGIGGLVFALAAKRRGFEVLVFERDVTVVRGEGQHRGPIQILSNALAALEAIDMDAAEEVMRAGCITGNRINGIVDGLSGNWYIKFDTFTPAAERGLPLTRIISRMTLQQILSRAIGEDVIMTESNVVNFNDDNKRVTVILDNGQRYEGDVLIGADGIRSKVRENLFGPSEAIYSGYTCYTGIADFVPADIETVGYQIFLGHKQYFVPCDLGGGKMQWYAFHKEPAGGRDVPQGKKQTLLKLFEGWCDNVIDLLLATDGETILRRDIYDRTPTCNWGKGRVTLLGDSVHAMPPNLGQGGCMAIEDSYQLAMELDKAWRQSVESGMPVDIISSLKRYQNARRLRVAVIHGVARMAGTMASMYMSYLGVKLGPLSLRVPNLGLSGGRYFMAIGMSLLLNWLLGGYDSNLEGRAPHCRLSDKANNQLQRWYTDDDALERALNADWFLLPTANSTAASETISLSRDENKPYVIGSTSNPSFPGVSITIPSPQVSKLHAHISYRDGAFFLTDLRSEHGTWIVNNEGRRYRVSPYFPTRFRPSYVIEFGCDKKAVFRVKVMKSPPRITNKKDEEELLPTRLQT